MRHGEVVHTEERDGFKITLIFEPEDHEPDWCFQPGEKTDVLRKIDSGELLWFCAKVTASREGITLGVDYLGDCCYLSVEEFMQPDGYYPDMVNRALEEARATLARMNGEVARWRG